MNNFRSVGAVAIQQQSVQPNTTLRTHSTILCYFAFHLAVWSLSTYISYIRIMKYGDQNPVSTMVSRFFSVNREFRKKKNMRLACLRPWTWPKDAGHVTSCGECNPWERTTLLALCGTAIALQLPLLGEFQRAKRLISWTLAQGWNKIWQRRWVATKRAGDAMVGYRWSCGSFLIGW